MRDAVFGLEALDVLPECLHRIGQIDHRAPNRTDLIGLVLGPGMGADRGGMEDAGSLDSRRHDRAKIVSTVKEVDRRRRHNFPHLNSSEKHTCDANQL